ncbi:MAG: hypothetical protein HY860_03010 [Chlamydiales bacterium]|nr:hypothetical protein [Chlamydiales bacterium]
MAIFFSRIGIYFLLMLVIGYLSNRHVHTLEDYIIAGRRLPMYLAMLPL